MGNETGLVAARSDNSREAKHIGIGEGHLGFGITHGSLVAFDRARFED